MARTLDHFDDGAGAVAPDMLDSPGNSLQVSCQRLARDEALWAGDLTAALQHLTICARQALDVASVSVWRRQEAPAGIVCSAFAEMPAAVGVHSRFMAEAAAPGYFRTLAAGGLVDAADALHDRRTAELVEHWLAPRGMGALLDAPLMTGGHLCGVLRVEHAGSARLWSREEQQFAVMLAGLVAQVMVFHAGKDSERRYRTLFNAAGDGIIMLRRGQIIDSNPRGMAMFGATLDVMRRSSRGDFSPRLQPDGRESVARLAELQAEVERGVPVYFEWVFRRPDGSVWQAEISATALRGDGDTVIMAIIRDVSERRATERARQESAMLLSRRNSALQVVNRLASHLHGMNDVSLIAAETVRVLRMLQDVPCITFLRVMPGQQKLERIAVSGESAGQLRREDADGIPLQGSLAGKAIASGRILISGDVEHDHRIDADAKVGLLNCGFRSLVVLPLIFNGEGLGSVGLLFKSEDVCFGEIEMETLNTICQTVSLAMVNARHVQVLEHQATHDSLTLLPNRTHLHREASRALCAARERAHSVALMLLDLDRFKEVNDTLGHHAGDMLLKQVGERLSDELASRDAMLARLGGDEFAILLRNAEDMNDAVACAVSVQRALHRHFDVQGIAIELGGSIGVAVYPQHGDTSNALLRCADVAMYAAKSAVDHVSVYDPELDPHNPRRLAMMTELGTAIVSNQLILHFQPKLDLTTGKWAGSEALVRWCHPQLGQIPPGEFIQFAETSDLIRPLTLWVARRAMEQMRDWQSRGLNLPVSINLSTRNLLDVTFPEAMAELLREFAIPPDMLELEITETALIGDPSRAMAVVERLVDLGMRFSIDDFGTGYSSLAYLKRLPLHALKIDRSFVHEMLYDEQDAIIVRSTIGLAHSLGLQVVAEGVEDDRTLGALRDFGCDLAQGYVLSKPMPAAEVEQYFRKTYRHT